MSNDLVFPSALLGSLPPHLLCCHSFHSSQHLPRAFHLWCTAGGFVTLGASVPARKICLSRCKRVSEGCIQFFFSPHRGEYFYGCGFYEIQEVNWTQFLLGSEKRINPGAGAKMRIIPLRAQELLEKKENAVTIFTFF